MITCACAICKKSVNENHRAIECSLCGHWVHIKCNFLDSKDYAAFQDEKNDYKSFFCLNCVSENLPFSLLNNTEFSISVNKGVINSEDQVVDFIPTSYQTNLFNQLNAAINNNAFDLDTDLSGQSDERDIIPSINCQYYSIDDFSAAKFSPSRNFSILHYNIHSIQCHIEEFRVALKMLDFNFDVICFSESKLHKDFAPKIDINIEGYHAPISTPTESSKGGVLIYVNKNLHFKPRSDLNIYKSKELESAFIEIINEKGANDVVGVIYKHPCMPSPEFIDVHLRSIFDKTSSDSKKLFIAGDFNFDLLNTSTHQDTFEFFDSMMSNFFLPVITLPTKINRGKNSLIDNIFTNHIHPDIKSGNLEINLSDGHLPSFIILPKQNQNHLPKKHNIHTRSNKNFNADNFTNDFLNVNWDEVIDIQSGDVNRSLNNFLSKFNNILDIHMPPRKISHKEFKQKYKPWISNDILSKIKAKNKILSRIRKCKDAARKSELQNQFNLIKNDITSSTRTGKKEYYRKYFTENKNNLRKVWKGIKEIINIKSKNFDSPTCLQVGDINITEPIAISNSFNEYFSTIADKILEKRKYNGNKSFRDFLANRITENFIFADCDEIEVSKIISSLSPSKSSGPNGIPTHILQLLKNDISGILASIYNLSLSSGVHPDLLKISKTIPIFKKGSRLLVSNYRPISLLSNLNKILEKIVHSRLYTFLEDSSCIYALQFGFRKKHSTNHTLIDITESIRKALDDKKFACGVFVDLQKAFDTVNHNILISKLEHYGVRGTANNWFASYLNNRSQYVSILGFDSTTKNISHGVPQGSVLGPLLFLLYINDLHVAIRYSKVYHFADDTNLLNIGNSAKQIQKNVNSDLKTLYQWLLANKISLNCDKTEVIFFHKPGFVVPEIKIKMNGLRIFPSKCIKYLGLYLDETLNGSFHCDILSKTLKRASGMLAKARHYISPVDLKSLYFAIFSSHLTYGCQIWAQVLSSFNRKIFKLQNRAMRVITFSDLGVDSTPIFRDLKVLKLEDHIILQNCLFVHDALHHVSPQCFHDIFHYTNEVHSLHTRSISHDRLFVKPSSTVRYGINSITSKCVSNWNHISSTLNISLYALSRPKLKQVIRDHLLGFYN